MNVTELRRIDYASGFMKAAHRSVKQKRKYTDQPYEVHPINVCNILTEFAGEYAIDSTTFQIALLHDLIEDTPITLSDIRAVFGDAVAVGVDYCTKRSMSGAGNRARRNEIDNQWYAQGDARSQSVKYADALDNARNIAEHDPKFAMTYLPEKLAMLEVCYDGNPELRRIAIDEIERLYIDLKLQKLEN